MLIPITTPQQDTCPEWAMIELQGEIQLLRDADAQELPVGTLVRKARCVLPQRGQSSTNCQQAADSYQLTIGYHQLEGTRVALKQPLLLLDKQRDASGTSYHVCGVVRSRLLFKTRPRSLITKPNGAH